MVMIGAKRDILQVILNVQDLLEHFPSVITFDVLSFTCTRAACNFSRNSRLDFTSSSFSCFNASTYIRHIKSTSSTLRYTEEAASIC